eukprot:scaffold53016_cov60-Attheya_sp.AAC.4
MSYPRPRPGSPPPEAEDVITVESLIHQTCPGAPRKATRPKRVIPRHNGRMASNNDQSGTETPEFPVITPTITRLFHDPENESVPSDRRTVAQPLKESSQKG